MDMEADELIRSWSSGPFPENFNPIVCTEKMETRLNGVYGVAISPDQLIGYWPTMEQWITGYMIGKSADYVVSKIANTLKQAYHDRAIGKKPPTPEEFRRLLIEIETTGTVIEPQDVGLIYRGKHNPRTI